MRAAKVPASLHICVDFTLLLFDAIDTEIVCTKRVEVHFLGGIGT